MRAPRQDGKAAVARNNAAVARTDEAGKSGEETVWQGLV